MLCKCVFQHIADHTVIIYTITVLCVSQVVAKGLIRGPSIEIISVNHCKWGVDYIPATEGRVARPPGLLPVRRDLKALRYILDFLQHVGGFTSFFDGLTHPFPERFLNVLLYDKDNPSEPRIQCIIDRIVNDDFTIGADRVSLLQSAITLPYASGHYDKRRI